MCFTSVPFHVIVLTVDDFISFSVNISQELFSHGLEHNYKNPILCNSEKTKKTYVFKNSRPFSATLIVAS